MMNEIKLLIYLTIGKSTVYWSTVFCYLIDLIGLIAFKSTDLILVAPCFFGRLAQILKKNEGGGFFKFF